uniref:ST8 alpha-N-acetyl-neuraminide alpha-2,8-sialyltransferase 1 n=1 Tax=Periophthalmus magnuspinnatus TaxID=409849 RepID=A0A3B3ZRF2_9GOBI
MGRNKSCITELFWRSVCYRLVSIEMSVAALPRMSYTFNTFNLTLIITKLHGDKQVAALGRTTSQICGEAAHMFSERLTIMKKKTTYRQGCQQRGAEGSVVGGPSVLGGPKLVVHFKKKCNLPPLSKQYTEDVGTRTHLVTANPSIIEKRFQNLLWSRKSFVDSMKAYGSSYIYMPAFSMKPGKDLSIRAHYALSDTSSNITMLFANPEFLRTVGKFWKSRGVHGKRLSTGLFLVSLALGLCEEVTAYGFWPFSMGLDEQPISHHYYDNILPDKWFHAMPEEFMQLWHLHKSGTLRMRVGHCPLQEGRS